jgi:tetratricopeptide (TPR) repeat protein
MGLMKRLFALTPILLLFVVASIRGDGIDDQYVRIYNVIQEADTLNNNGQLSPALSRYVEAQNALQRFQRLNPEWNPKIVGFRLNYLGTKVATLSAKAPPPPAAVREPSRPTPQSGGPPAVVTREPPKGGTPNATLPVPSREPTRTATTTLPRVVQPDYDAQVNTLRDQVRQLQADKILLEAKLKEAFSAQPAEMDPAELAKAQERLKKMEKENDLLKYSLQSEKARQTAAPPANGPSLEKTKQLLAEANRKLTEQTDRANSLAAERASLEKKMQGLAPTAWNATALETTRKALEDANRQLLTQKQHSDQLEKDKEVLQARLKTQQKSGGGEELAALRAENLLLKKQVADSRSTPGGKGPDPVRQLALAQAQIASLQSDKEILRLEKIVLEGRVKTLMAQAARGGGTAVAAGSTPATGRPEDLLRIRQLESERDDLARKLGWATKDLAARAGKGAMTQVQELENQVATLRARLQVYEARPVPYTAQELALFKSAAPAPKTPGEPARGNAKPIRELPPGSAGLVAEAQRYFRGKQFDKAEESYQKILKQDPKNSAALANLGAIQLEANHLDAADKSLSQAAAEDPDDAYTLSTLGYLRFRQTRYKESLDTLSRAAQLDPHDPQIQNYLGLTLNQMGMRGAAETALRKAVELQPGYGSAHFNLAVIYTTQKPPLVELARWHYQKALAAGHPEDKDLEKLFDTTRVAERK